MKSKSDNGHPGVSSPVSGCKRNYPMKYRAQGIFEIEIFKNNPIFFPCQDRHGDHAVNTAANKNDKGNPYKRAADKSVEVMHNPFPPFIRGYLIA
jgi:hypothetical protein